MATRCRECHAAIHAPAALDAVTMKCGYCGLEQPVPDLHERRKLLLEEQREARLRAEREAHAEAEKRRHELEREKHADERRDKRRDRRRGWLMAPFTLIPLLVGPLIVAVTVFDAPARLGCTASGGDRLEQMVTQLVANGCTVLHPVESQYADDNVSQLVEVAAGQCVRVLVAGGTGHRELGLTLYASSSSTAVAKIKASHDPVLLHCAPAADTLRYVINVGTSSKGRLSHGVLACPAPPPPPAKKPKSR